MSIYLSENILFRLSPRLKIVAFIFCMQNYSIVNSELIVEYDMTSLHMASEQHNGIHDNRFKFSVSDSEAETPSLILPAQ